MTDTLCLKAICQKLNSCRDTSFPLPDAIGKKYGKIFGFYYTSLYNAYGCLGIFAQ